MPAEGAFGSTSRLKVATTSSALKVLPLWNLTPWRSFTVQTLASSLVQEVASSGWTLRWIVRKAGGVGRPAFGEDLPLHLLHLPFQAVDPLLRRRRRLPLGKGGRRHERHGGARRESGDQSRFHVVFPTLRVPKSLCTAAACAAMNPIGCWWSAAFPGQAAAPAMEPVRERVRVTRAAVTGAPVAGAGAVDAAAGDGVFMQIRAEAG